MALNRSAGRRRFAAGAVAVILLAGACSSQPATKPGTPASSSAAGNTPEWPGAMAALGHSGLTGYQSDGGLFDVPANSWATGTDPAVDSMYLRILAANPAIEGNAQNFAVDGADVSELAFQASRVADMNPKPDLILIQSIDGDMQCDSGDDANLPVYRDKLTKVLDTLTTIAPDADILFVSQPADVQEYSDTVLAVDPTHIAGTGPCDVVDPATRQLVPSKVDGLQALVDEYFDAIGQVCARYPRCRTDNGAMQSMDLDPGDLTRDLNHLTVTGLAKMAAIEWSVLYPGR